MSQVIQRDVGKDAIAVLARKHDMRLFDVPYKIEGVVRVCATDAESAKAAVDAISPRRYAEDGELETFSAKDVEDDQ